MRVVTVLGVVAAGLGIGTAAVMAPLAVRSAPPVGGWFSDWGNAALSQMRPTPAEPTTVTNASAQIVDAKAPPYLAKPEPPVAKVAADAKVVEQPWTTQVTVAPENVAPRKQTSSKPTSDDQRRELVRDIQRELKRVGCYDGDTDGQWGGASKRAMTQFTARVNATLPSEEPDFILLTLVQGHKGGACGADCPSGQKLNDGGRCLPSSVLAQAERVRQPKPETAVPAQSVVPTDTKTAAATVGSAWSATTIKTPVETGSITPPPGLSPIP
jgi:hypothetical protein